MPFENEVSKSSEWDGGYFLGSSQAFWDAPSFWKEVVSMCIAGQDVHIRHSSVVTQSECGRGMT